MRAGWLLTGLCLLLQACATEVPKSAVFEPQMTAVLPGIPEPATYQGRLSVRVESPVDQSLNANFSLTGTALAGALELFGPLGATVAQLRWGPGFAQLRQQGQTNDFPNLPSMLAELTGTTLPTAAVFDWLAGKGLAGVVPPGWSLLEGSEPDTRRLRMVRQTPVPAVRLTILLDDPA